MAERTDALDLLEDAVAMIEFMAEVSPALANNNRVTDGINQNAAFGLGLIFTHIQHTIEKARDLA